MCLNYLKQVEKKCECVIRCHCSAQLSMFNMEKRYGNKIIIIIIKMSEKCEKRLKNVGNDLDV